MNFIIEPPDEPCPDCGSTKHRFCNPVPDEEDPPTLRDTGETDPPSLR